MKIKKFGATEQKVYDLVKPAADDLGLSIWDVRFEKEGAAWYLRIFIDKDTGIGIEDCENLTRPANDILDKEDPIPQSYFLEVGSAGIERELLRESHFEVSKGKQIRIRMIREIDGVKDFIIILNEFNKESISGTLIADGSNNITLPIADIAYVKLYDEFDEF